MAAFGTDSGGTVRRDGSWTAFRAACASGAIMLREGSKAYLAQRYMEHARVLFPIIRGKQRLLRAMQRNGLYCGLYRTVVLVQLRAHHEIDYLGMQLGFAPAVQMFFQLCQAPFRK